MDKKAEVDKKAEAIEPKREGGLGDMVVIRKFDAHSNVFDRIVSETDFAAFDADWIIISRVLSENLQTSQ